MKIIKEILSSKIAYLTMLFHWVLCALAIYQRGGLSHQYHFIYEPILFKLVSVLDLVWITLAESFTGNSAGVFDDPSLTFIAGFLLAGLQWFLIGYFIDKIKTNKLK